MQPGTVPRLRTDLGCVAAALTGAWGIWGVAAGWQWPALIPVIPDDAFYYLEGARRLAGSGVVSLDGIHPGSGFHPGWMVLLAAASRLSSNGGTGGAFLVHALALSQALFCLAAVLIFVVLRNLVPRLAGVGAAAWLLSPLTLLMAVQATEAGLYACLLLAACGAIISGPLSGNADRVDAPRRLILVGVALGLAFYGRTEALVIAAVTFVWLPAVAPRPVTVGRRARRVAIPLACFVVVILPWFLYLYATTGTFEQGSGAMKQLWADEEWRRLGLRRFEMFARFPVGTAAIVSLAGLLGALGWRRVSDARAWRVACWAFSTSSVVALVYLARITDYQIWHLAGMSVLCAVGAAALAAAHGIERRRLASSPAAGAFVVLAAACAGWIVTQQQVEGYPWQRNLHARLPELEQWVPAGEPIAALNAGIPVFFSDRLIVAVDGLMNDSLVPHWKRGEVDVALAAAGIRYLLDNESSLARLRRFSTPALQADELHCVPQRAVTARLCVWRLR